MAAPDTDFGEAYVRVLDALRSGGSTVTVNGGTAKAQCPAHLDRNPSLSIKDVDGRVLIHCFAECEPVDVVDALGLTMADLYDAKASDVVPGWRDEVQSVVPVPTMEDHDRKHIYRTADGEERYAIVINSRDGIKEARPFTRTDDGFVSGWNGPRILFRLDELIRSDGLVLLTEGEKDTDTAIGLGYAATTSPFGAGSWHHVNDTPLEGRNVVILPDNDRAGHKYGQQIAASLAGRASSVKIVDLPSLPEGGDLTDWVENGGRRADLDRLVDAIAEYQPVAHTERALDRKLQLVSAASVVPINVEWLSKARIPLGALTVLAGFGGLGKTAYTAFLAAQVTRGETDGLHVGQPMNVVICSAEDTWQHTLSPRLIAAGADMNRVFWVAATGEVNEEEPDPAAITIPQDIADLEEAIRMTGDVTLVVFDPLVAFIGDETDT